MPRTARKAPAGIIFHVLNRGVGRRGIFEKDEDYAAFERVMAHALAAEPVNLLAYCLMPNHWRLLVCPQEDEQLGRLMQLVTTTHTRRSAVISTNPICHKENRDCRGHPHP